MKIAIHKSDWGYSNDWINYCVANNIDHKIVNCYATDIIAQTEDCDIIMWHHHHTLAKDKIFAKDLLFALQQAGKKVFPDFNSGWHFDDKLGQKYLLEGIKAPLVPTDVFYSEKEALNWAAGATFPKVFKLRGGAGSSNVKLLRTRGDAEKMIRKAFGGGFASYDRWGNIKETLRKYSLKKAKGKDVLKSIRRAVVSTEFARIHGSEKGYVLLQEFIPNNKFDIRVITIGGKAFGIKRMVRDNDFRASGSGFVKHKKEDMDIRCVEIALDVTEKLNAQSLAYDFVFDEQNTPLIVEISYGFGTEGSSKCEGYWDKNLQWHEGKFISAHFIIESVIQSL